MTRAEALLTLLSQPDESSLLGMGGRPRGYRYVLSRHPVGLCCADCARVASSDPDVLKRDLGVAYAERRRHESGRDISAIVSVRRKTRLKIVRTA